MRASFFLGTKTARVKIPPAPTQMPAERAVVVTGSSSGIGRATALRLAGNGWIVFGGVRSEADGERLAALHPNLRPVILDVTNAADLAEAARSVALRGVPLRGVVSNAGVAVAGPLEFLPLDAVRRQFEVNVFGALAVTQTFMPLLRTTRGRLVFVGSIAGRLSPPFVAPYAASKHALAAFADSLRVELHDSGVRVALVEPGPVATPIWEKGRAGKDALIASMPPEAMRYYTRAIAALAAQAGEEERRGMKADDVARAIESALTAPRPRARYLLGRPARIQAAIALLPEDLRDRLIRKAMKL
ncbi:MAG: SDR family oxidoreductase [Firmicutes bacterium]|nr:SDR family oxidoreductase [Bacillota bacterium]